MKDPTSSRAAKNSKKIQSDNQKNKMTPCCTKEGLKRGPWTPEEDEKLSSYISKEGEGRWRTLPIKAGLLRCGKSCRLRWMNYLRPSVKRGRIAPDEEDLILRLHRLLGNRWSLIAGRIPGRTDNEIKNYWNTHLSKKLISQGLDPRTHKPLEPNYLSPSNDKPSSSKHIQSPNPIFKPMDSSYHPIHPINFNEHHGYEHHGYYHEGTNVNLDQELNLQSSEWTRNEENHEDDDINYTDDVFSSFLNSLINEDVFNNNQNQMQQLVNGHTIVPQVSSLDTFSLPHAGLTFGAGWDAPIMSAFPQNQDPKSFIDDTIKK